MQRFKSAGSAQKFLSTTPPSPTLSTSNAISRQLKQRRRQFPAGEGAARLPGGAKHHGGRAYPLYGAEGLVPSNLIVWAKTNAGMGSLYRSQHELLPLFKNGSAPHVNNVELGKRGR